MHGNMAGEPQQLILMIRPAVWTSIYLRSKTTSFAADEHYFYNSSKDPSERFLHVNSGLIRIINNKDLRHQEVGYSCFNVLYS
jgi:hypothetical protein